MSKFSDVLKLIFSKDEYRVEKVVVKEGDAVCESKEVICLKDDKSSSKYVPYPDEGKKEWYEVTYYDKKGFNDGFNSW